MKTDTTCESQATLAARRAAYEAEVANALLDESAAEREERLELVRAAQRLILHALLLDDEPIEN